MEAPEHGDRTPWSRSTVDLDGPACILASCGRTIGPDSASPTPSVNLYRDPVFIAGVAESPLGEVTDQTELSMVALAAREALAEAGMTLADVDAIFAHKLGEEGT